MQNEHPETRKKARKKILMDTIGVLLIILSPFVFKLHQYLPSEPNATINILGLEINNHGFADLNTFAWFLLSKIVPFYLFILWFLTCKHWWYHIILIPATMYAFQIYEVLYSEDNIVDTKNIIWLLPVCMVVIPLVYFIRIKLVDKYVHGIDLEAMEAELTALKKKQASREENAKLDKFISSETADKVDEDGNTEDTDKVAQLNTEKGNSFKQAQHRISNWLQFKF
ncbi:Conserved hypothetical membrane protein [Zobellia galactanivorans]|uniref:Conserved hypothetical membrane protein n=2 Tax=Flavobacteriaceae TaxID=49546 RepID=G0L6V3_ZOBGA|nr:hypothetical protein [Zobellia galactanivorans]OWW26098.1 hypothetical protein B4Q04_10385 [Zobellia sp. OII3]CAZ98667.1 Conserved hypothetical membrane protein [Zobellia galactanivorans]